MHGRTGVPAINGNWGGQAGLHVRLGDLLGTHKAATNSIVTTIAMVYLSPKKAPGCTCCTSAHTAASRKFETLFYPAGWLAGRTWLFNVLNDVAATTGCANS